MHFVRLVLASPPLTGGDRGVGVIDTKLYIAASPTP